MHYGDMHYPIAFGGELHYPVGFLWKSEAEMLGEQKPPEPCATHSSCCFLGGLGCFSPHL